MAWGKRPVHVKHNRKVKHLLNLMLLMFDDDMRDHVKAEKVAHECISGTCYGAGMDKPPITPHIKVRTPGFLFYGCLTCGQQFHIDGLGDGDLDVIEDMPYELQQLAINDYKAFKVAINRHLKEKYGS